VASDAALAAVAREVPLTQVSAADLDDVIGLVRLVGLATSNGEARRLLEQKGCRANGLVLAVEGADGKKLADVTRLQGRYILLRKGKTTFHLVDVITP
jgi:tyrosyl-tRNA synthetase